jgi:hypothetical protein
MYLYAISFFSIDEDGGIWGSGVHLAKLERKLSVALFPVLHEEILDSAKKEWSEKTRRQMRFCPISAISISNVFEDPSNPDR